MSLVSRCIKVKPKEGFDWRPFVFWLPLFALIGFIMLDCFGYRAEAEKACWLDTEYTTWDNAREMCLEKSNVIAVLEKQSISDKNVCLSAIRNQNIIINSLKEVCLND
jgi:hypothetical protein